MHIVNFEANSNKATYAVKLKMTRSASNSSGLSTFDNNEAYFYYRSNLENQAHLFDLLILFCNWKNYDYPTLFTYTK